MQQCIPFPWPEQIYEVINTVFDIGMRTQRKGDITPRAGKAAHSAVQQNAYAHASVGRPQQFCEKALRSLAAFDTMIADVQCALRGTDHFHAACKRILWLLHQYGPVRPAADAVKAVGLGKVSRLAGKQIGQHTSGKDINQIGKQQAQGIARKLFEK